VSKPGEDDWCFEAEDGPARDHGEEPLDDQDYHSQGTTLGSTAAAMSSFSRHEEGEHSRRWV
jgi:hypothetical protein